MVRKTEMEKVVNSDGVNTITDYNTCRSFKVTARARDVSKTDCYRWKLFSARNAGKTYEPISVPPKFDRAAVVIRFSVICVACISRHQFIRLDFLTIYSSSVLSGFLHRFCKPTQKHVTKLYKPNTYNWGFTAVVSIVKLLTEPEQH